MKDTYISSLLSSLLFIILLIISLIIPLFIEITTFYNIYWLQQYYKYIEKTSTDNKLNTNDNNKNNLAKVNYNLRIIIYVLIILIIIIVIILFYKGINSFDPSEDIIKKNIVLISTMTIIFVILFILNILSILISIAIASLNIENYSGDSGKKYIEYCKKKTCNTPNNKRIISVQIAHLVFICLGLLGLLTSKSSKK